MWTAHAKNLTCSLKLHQWYRVLVSSGYAWNVEGSKQGHAVYSNSAPLRTRILSVEERRDGYNLDDIKGKSCSHDFQWEMPLCIHEFLTLSEHAKYLFVVLQYHCPVKETRA